MMDEGYILAIVALLPISANLLVFQTNPYQALVIRGMLGAVAALIYALLGAADVALTEALVGTMLSITLYAVAVRSSMSFRLGFLEADVSSSPDPYIPLLPVLRGILTLHHMRLERVNYPSPQALKTALIDKDIHGICLLSADDSDDPAFVIQTRVHRLYTLMQTGLNSQIKVTYVDPSHLSALTDPTESEYGSLSNADTIIPKSVEVQA